MIDVTIQPVGRTILGMALGAMKYQAMVNQKNMQQLVDQVKEIKRLQTESEQIQNIVFDATSGMIDKRFNVSKEYIRSGGKRGAVQFKKTTSQSDRALQRLAERQALSRRVQYNRSVSNFQKTLQDKKMRQAFHQVDLKQYM